MCVLLDATISGPDVLEGVRQLAKAGLTSIPMKDHVGKIHHLARNKFNIHMKTAAKS